MKRPKKRTRRLLVVEEVFTEAEEVCHALKRGFPTREIKIIPTESEFHADFERIVADPPALIVIDVMLRWENPKPKKTPRPPDVAREGSRRAGIRIQRMLAKRSETRNIPVILFTQLREEDLQGPLAEAPGHVRYLAKSEGPEAILQLAKKLVNR